MKENVINVLSLINNNLWIFTTIVIVITGIYLTIKLKGIQFNVKKMLKSLKKKNNDTSGLSPFKTLMLALAGRIGVGSISGVALAIYVGGAGTIFWIWIISLISAPLAYAESYLGVKYKQHDGKHYIGGPAYYLKEGLKSPKLGALYAILIIICYVIGYMSVQANTIMKATYNIISVKPMLIGLILSIISALIIFGGIKKISNATSKIVPFMSGVYIFLALFIIFKNISMVGSIFNIIIKSAFNFKSFTGGFLATLLMGVQRGLFSNEAGIGTGSIAAASGNDSDPKSSGRLQMIGVYITSLFICTATAIIILLSSYSKLNLSDVNGIEIASYAFNYHLSDFGNIILSISIFLFAFSTILTGYYYGESSLKYLTNNKGIVILKVLTTLIIFLGCIMSPTIIWKFTDIFIGLIALINIYAIVRLRSYLT